MKDYYADYHVHTEFSDDSVYPIEDVVRDAIKKGIDEICITDHIDYGVKVDRDSGEKVIIREGYEMYNADVPKLYNAYSNLKEKYKDRIRIKFGLEFGVQTHTIPKYNDLFNKFNFDFIILSVHQVDNKEFWAGDYQNGKTQDEYILGYYNELLKVTEKYHNYSVLGHLDLMNRYDKFYPYPFEKTKDIVEAILKNTINNGSGIELNTSYKRYGLNSTTPCIEILKMYKDLGGDIITFGSDSHKPEHLGAYIDEAKDICRNLGYKYFCTFDRMKPNYIKL